MQTTREPWFRRRGYLHFDRPVGQAAALTIVSDPVRVAQRSFFPFLDFDILSTKVKWDDDLEQLVRKRKERKVAYASHIDSHIYSYYCQLLSARYEQELTRRGLEDCVLAFRSLGKSNIHFAAEGFTEVSRRSNCFVLGLDIRGFFDTLDHKILKSAWMAVLGVAQLSPDHYAVYKAITRFSMVNLDSVLELLGISKNNPKKGRNRLCSPEDFREKVRPSGMIRANSTGKGIPQGSSISALLSNIYMLEFDCFINEYVEGLGGKYFRYCDDMLFVLPLAAKTTCEAVIKDAISKCKLEIQDAKTERRDFVTRGGRLVTDKPLQYLGFLFDGERIYLRSASLARYSDRLMRGMHVAKATMRKRNRARVARGADPRPLFMGNLMRRYTYFGRRNFISYGYRAAKIMNSQSIRKQLRPLWTKFQLALKEERRKR
ncbi:Reverse transcriptase (RNA-dependent DNA polymerase) [Duganella sp. CF517]|uniref:antiviral reverse transcriptase Drt2 n=1 Tax=Duganella sp. CF517 TaxID=1881038 RepID=UPI0008B14402|nr:antiviral reverse transcriptase Drt2 [Duganella sp. CF517]SEO57673.1 Reverse transcriptase (RNA-dependent DNA polymerase) [Duganella sp. CF517]